MSMWCTDGNCRQRAKAHILVFSWRFLCFTHTSGLISPCYNQWCSDGKTRRVRGDVELTPMRGQGKQWQGQFQSPISLQIEVSRGARSLNEDIAASDHSTSARWRWTHRSLQSDWTRSLIQKHKNMREKWPKIGYLTTHLICKKSYYRVL